jgi:hypothetical protein
MADKRRQLATFTLVLFLGLLLVALFVPVLAGTALTATPNASAYLPLIANPEATATPIPGSGWLWHVNQFRASSGLPALTENSDWSTGGIYHSRYMVYNDAITHHEDSNNPWYTAEGAAAGQNGNIYVSSWMAASDETAIDWWMTAPFHAVALIDPELQMTGFGSFREDVGVFKMGATIDTSRGRSGLPPGTTFPITFPGDGGSTWLTTFGGFEWPNPLTSCPGYSAPTGPAIIIQLGDGSVTPNVTATAFSDGGGPLAHCVIDETNYTHPTSSTQNTGRWILGSRDAVVILPRFPLTVGQTYDASVTENGNDHNWRFTVIPATGFGWEQQPVWARVAMR